MPVFFRRRSLAFFLCVGALIQASAQEHKTWSDYGGAPDDSKFVDFKQIDKTNVSKLTVAWTYPSGDDSMYVFSPVIDGNVMYVLARNTSLVALDATTGKEIWVHSGLIGIAPRGINFWKSKDGKDKRLIFQLHHQLQEIDATTGKSIESFGTNGYVDLRQGLGRDPQSIIRIQSQNPGKVFENLLLMGSTTGENFMSPPGDIRAFDVVTGKVVWQFHTLPHPGEPGYDTWPKDAWRYVGGVNDWAELSVDAKRGIVYIPLGSGTYDFYGADRIGNDLYANCILALDARTGKYKWHFQEVHHDLWDFDAVSAPQLITIMHNGKKVDAVAHAGKTGFLYVLDRETGKPIWPIEERPVPASDMPGEVASKTQPFPTVVPAFGRQKFTSADINPYLPEARKAELVKRIDESRNEGIFTPPGFKETVSMPGNQGGSNWGTTASNPAKGEVYVLSLDAPALLKMSTEQPSMRALGNAGRPVAAPGATPVNDPGRAVYEKNCMMCHGPERTGGGAIPSLVDITTRLSPDVIEGIVQNGNGQMPAFSNLDTTQLHDLIAYLGIGATGPAVAATPPSTKPAGPVVADGGVPAGEVLAKTYITGRSPWGIMDGPAYPAGTNAPTERYFSGWNVMTSIIAPPWNKLTAYDLNKGTIKWQKSVGTDPGIVTTEHGLAANSTGLIFLPTQDGKVRAYDADTGDVLWTADLPAGSRTVPSIYEVNGKEYLVVDATANLVLGNGNPDSAPPSPAKLQRAYVAYALPDKK